MLKTSHDTNSMQNEGQNRVSEKLLQWTSRVSSWIKSNWPTNQGTPNGTFPPLSSGVLPPSLEIWVRLQTNNIKPGSTGQGAFQFLQTGHNSFGECPIIDQVPLPSRT